MRGPRTGSAMLASLVATGSLLAGAVGTIVYVETQGIHLRKLKIMPADGRYVDALPKQFGEWETVGADARMAKEAVDALGTDNFVSRNYLAPRDSAIAREVFGEDDAKPIAVSLHVAYYTGMVDTVPHVPERCLVGAGMQIAGPAANYAIPLDRSRLIADPSVPEDVLASMEPDGGQIMMARSAETFSRVRLPPNLDELAMRITPFRGGESEQEFFSGYFFLANGELVPNANQVRLKAFELEDDYAYYMKVQFTCSDVRTPEELATVAGSMLDGMFADLMLRTPDWVEVRRGTYPPGRDDAPAGTVD